MTEYDFTLVLEGDTTSDKTIDALFEAGCGDATFGEVDGVFYAEFHRPAESFSEAVASAIQAVESVDGLRVLRVEPDDLLTVSEIADRLGRSRESVRLLIAGKRGQGDFPAPISHLRTRNRLWRWSEVAMWAERADAEEIHQAQVLAAINAALELRNRSAELPSKERRLVTALSR